MITNKKIKKLEKVNKNSAARFKKGQARPVRSNFEIIHKPPRDFAESEIHLFESDMFFGVKDGQIHFDLSMLNTFKYITSVEVRKDLSEKIATILLEPKLQYPVSSWRKMVEEFEGNQGGVFEGFAEKMTTFGTKYEAFLQNYENMKKCITMEQRVALFKMKQQSASRRLFLLSSYPAFELRYRLKKDEVKLTELCLNETFLKEIGYSLDNFTNTVLTEGIPQFCPRHTSPDLLLCAKSLFENYMVNDIETPEGELEFYMKTGHRKKFTFKTLQLVEMYEGEVILSLVLYLTNKSFPFGNYQKHPYSPDFLEILKANEKQKEYLLKNYYGESFQGFHNNNEKVCKITEISSSKN